MRAHGTLTAWLREQLDQEERLARACIPDNGHGQWSIDHERAYSNPALADSGIRMISGWEPVLPHIATWDPIRVLAEIEAKREMLADIEMRGGTGARFAAMMARPYAGRDGWLDEWGC